MKVMRFKYGEPSVKSLNGMSAYRVAEPGASVGTVSMREGPLPMGRVFAGLKGNSPAGTSFHTCFGRIPSAVFSMNGAYACASLKTTVRASGEDTCTPSQSARRGLLISE